MFSGQDGMTMTEKILARASEKTQSTITVTMSGLYFSITYVSISTPTVLPLFFFVKGYYFLSSVKH